VVALVTPANTTRRAVRFRARAWSARATQIRAVFARIDLAGTNSAGRNSKVPFFLPALPSPLARHRRFQPPFLTSPRAVSITECIERRVYRARGSVGVATHNFRFDSIRSNAGRDEATLSAVTIVSEIYRKERNAAGEGIYATLSISAGSRAEPRTSDFGSARAHRLRPILRLSVTRTRVCLVMKSARDEQKSFVSSECSEDPRRFCQRRRLALAGASSLIFLTWRTMHKRV